MQFFIPIRRHDESTELREVTEYAEPMTTVIDRHNGGSRRLIRLADIDTILDGRQFTADSGAKTYTCELYGIGPFEDIDAVKRFYTDILGYEIDTSTNFDSDDDTGTYTTRPDGVIVYTPKTK